MSITFTKLFTSITESTIWVEDHETRIAWITMLAMADRKGRVWGSIPGLASRARVSLPACELALTKFMAPDKYSRTYTPECEGRRIEQIPGGWRLLNHKYYRDIRDEQTTREQTAVRVANHRKKKRNVTLVTLGNYNAEAEAEAEAIKATSVAMSGKPAAVPRISQKEPAKRVLAFLNEKTGRAYRETESNLKLIEGRLREGYDEEMCRSVIARKFREWKNDDKMRLYLRPATLFNREKFNQYAGECVE